MKTSVAIFLFYGIQLFSQNRYIDSLQKVAGQANNDTVKLNAMLQMVQVLDEENAVPWNDKAEAIGKKLVDNGDENLQLRGKKCLAEVISNRGFWLLNKGENRKSLELYMQAVKVQEETGDQKNLANSINSIGLIHYNLGEIAQAIEYYNRALKIYERIGNDEGMGGVTYNLAIIFQKQGNVPLALENYGKALRSLEKMKHAIGIVRCLIATGEIHGAQGDEEKAIEHYNKALAIAEKSNDQVGITTAYNDLGFSYHHLGKTNRAIEYHLKSLKGREKIDDKNGIAMSLTNLGCIYQEQGKPDTALKCFQRGLVFRRQINSKWGLSNSMNNIGGIYYDLRNYKLAKVYVDSSLALSKALGYPSDISSAEGLLSKIDSATGNLQGALSHYRLYIFYRDSTNNEKTRKASIRNQLNDEFEKKEMLLNERNEKERAVAKEKSFVQRVIIVCAVVGLLIVIIFSIFIGRSLKITRFQKHIIEEKQNEIIDSIKYAKRIQASLLPQERYLDGTLLRLRRGRSQAS